jgi:hypothetical protein
MTNFEKHTKEMTYEEKIVFLKKQKEKFYNNSKENYKKLEKIDNRSEAFEEMIQILEMYCIPYDTDTYEGEILRITVDYSQFDSLLSDLHWIPYNIISDLYYNCPATTWDRANSNGMYTATNTEGMVATHNID